MVLPSLVTVEVTLHLSCCTFILHYLSSSADATFLACFQQNPAPKWALIGLLFDGSIARAFELVDWALRR